LSGLSIINFPLISTSGEWGGGAGIKSVQDSGVQEQWNTGTVEYTENRVEGQWCTGAVLRTLEYRDSGLQGAVIGTLEYRDNGIHGQWSTRPVEYGQWVTGTEAVEYWDNGVHGYWKTETSVERDIQ
jgi:hypothetical protein